jgi:serine/threonine protein kinase/tetratricopeptide (TPR) repeat protein
LDLRDPVAEWNELSALYEHAETLPPAELEHWLAGLRGQSSQLLPSLERMLAARARMAKEGFLETLPALPLTTSRDVAEWDIGSRLGAYRLLRHIGSGGMAEVWLAERADGAFERQVALKLLYNHPSRSQRDAFAERFRRERDILASLNHPHIAGLHDAGVTPSGQPWLALEFVRGERITDWCDERRLDVRSRIDLFMQVLDAVAYAHANLVVHRDLKPANILVTEDGQVKLLDFGIAKLLDAVEGAGKDSDVTRHGGRPLTPQYASPEQLRGLPLTTTSDVYSSGVVLYELLSGARPVQLREGATPAQVEIAILEAEPTPLSKQAFSPQAAERRSANPRSLARLLAGDLEAIVANALDKLPEKRYRSAEAFRDDLVRWCEGRPVEATHPSASDRLWKFYRRHSLAVGLSGLVLAVVAGLSVTAVVNGLRARSESSRAVASRAFLVELFKLADPQSSRGQQMSPSEMLRIGARKALETLGHQPDVQADVLRDIGRMQTYADEIVDADANLRLVVRMLVEQGRHREWLHAQADLAENAFDLGDIDRVEAVLKEIETPVREAGDDPGLQARFWYLSGVASRSRFRLSAAIEELNTSLRLSSRANGESAPDTIDVLRELGDAYSVAGRHADAIRLLEDALYRLNRNTAAGPRDRLAVEMHLAAAMVRAGRYAGLMPRFREMLDRCDRDMGPASDHCTTLLAWFADLALRLEDRNEQARLLPRLEQAARNTSSPWRQAVGATAAGYILAVQGQLGSRHELRIQLEQIHTADRLPYRDRTQALLPLAVDAIVRRDGRASELFSDRALSFQRSLQSPDRALTARAMSLRGLARSAQNRYEDALGDVRAARIQVEELLGRDHALTQIYLCNEAAILIAMGQGSGAKSLIGEAMVRLGPQLEGTPLLSRLEQLSAKVQQGTPVTAPDVTSFFFP